MDIQIGTRIWDTLNDAGMTVIEVRHNGTQAIYICKDDSPHVGNWTLWASDFDGSRFEVEV